MHYLEINIRHKNC